MRTCPTRRYRRRHAADRGDGRSRPAFIEHVSVVPFGVVEVAVVVLLLSYEGTPSS